MKTKEELQSKLEKLKAATAKLEKQIQGIGKNKSGWYKDYNYPKWLVYKDFEKSIVCGFDGDGDWFYDNNNLALILVKGEYLATTEEEKEALITEAKKRGFKKGVRAKNQWTEFTCFENYLYKDGELMSIKDNISYTLFASGKWATIIEEPKVVINGYKMKQDGDIISFGCARFTKDQLKGHLKELSYYKFFGKNSEGENIWGNRTIKSITLDSGVEITIEQLKQIVDNIK